MQVIWRSDRWWWRRKWATPARTPSAGCLENGKMAPWLSPGKTWAGFVGALVGSSLSAWGWLHFATPLFNSTWQPPAWYWSLLFGGLIGLVGLIGDLCESLIKRDMQQKDAAALMPGFGGLLDLLDSLLYAGPVAFILWKILPLQTW